MNESMQAAAIVVALLVVGGYFYKRRKKANPPGSQAGRDRYPDERSDHIDRRID